MQGIIVLVLAIVVGPLLVRSLVTALEHHASGTGKVADKPIRSAVAK